MFDARDGVVMQLSLYNMPVGTYRVALHERGNCTSPNLFSAGPAWAPPGAGKAPADLLPEFVTDTEGDLPTYTAYIRGARVEGPLSLRGRSVVIHFGRKIDDAFPGQPNNRIACGVLEPIASTF
jgi:Cu/Zn superoxide dismutase